MNDLLQLATVELAKFLQVQLPTLSPDWWSCHVLSRLSYQQQRIAEERKLETLEALDLAALLRVFDQNWYELSTSAELPREGRSWLKELQTIRNRWAHQSSESIPPSEVYRDADTLGRLLSMVGGSQSTMEFVETTKSQAVSTMAKKDASPRPHQTGDDAVASSPADKATSLFQVGNLVSLRSNPAVLFPVLEVLSGQGEFRYRVFENNAKATYFESQLMALPSSSDERQTMSADQAAAFVTSLHLLSSSTASLFSMRTGRIQFVPYQYRPVLKLIRSDRPRLLIADEVGVGKTIEAGLIIKELKARMDLSSVLIICPRPLVMERKWFHEMKRFDETFTALDGQLLRHCLRETDLDGEWPEQYAKAILPFSLFDSDLLHGKQGRRGPKKKKGLLSLDPPPKFDLVIVDEAHHIRNSNTFLHQGVRFFCDHAEAVVFLSATPVQLGTEDLFTLLNVLRPDVVIDQASFNQMAAPNRPINRAVEACRSASESWLEEARTSFEEVAATEWGRMFLRETPAFQKVSDQLRAEIISDKERVELTRDLEDLYTFGSMINRTRRRDIGEFTTRKPTTLTIDFTASQGRLHDGLLKVISRILTLCHGQQNVKFMMTTIRRQAASCLYGLAPLLDDILTGKLNQLEAMIASDSDVEIECELLDDIRAEISELLEQARDLEPDDPKADALIKAVIEKVEMPGNNKVLVFSTFRHTLRYLSQKLESAGLRFGLIHGDIPDEDRSDLRRRFGLNRENEEALDILLSSEVGCEGLDFQFCDFLVNYDLPWNPMRIEQRIGRIDRYGQQSEAVAIVNLITPGTVDADIYERCLLRIGVFQHSIGGNEEILGTIAHELRNIAESFDLTPEERNKQLLQLADNEIRRVKETEDLEAKQASFFGLNIPKAGWESEVEAAQDSWLSAESIHRCVSAYLKERLEGGTEFLSGGKQVKNLRLSQPAREKLLLDYQGLPTTKDAVGRQWEKWLKGDNPNLAVTFLQEAAAEDSQIVHLSLVHPLIRQAAQYWEAKNSVFVSLSACDAEVPPGRYPFAIYRWRKRGIRDDEELIAIAQNEVLQNKILTLLAEAHSSDQEHFREEDFDELDTQHHEKWRSAQANHIASIREQVEHRIQSLAISHEARRRTIEDQINNATNERIRVMKESEMARAEADYNRRMAELKRAAESGDIHATQVILGTMTIE